MAKNERSTELYQDLASWYDHSGQAKLRDTFLVLAADAALAEGHADDAEYFRKRLLDNNPHHLLKPFRSFQEALQSPDVQTYVKELRRTHPPDAAARLLATQRQAEADRKLLGNPVKPRQAGQSSAWTELFPRAAEEPKVFRMQPSAGEARPKPAPVPAPPPPKDAVPRPRPQSAGPVRIPQAGPRIRPPQSEEDGAVGAWLSSALFFLLLLAGLALAVYTFVGPFLPPHWLPI